jgi:CheY-like chemotaxis protein
VIPHVDQVSSGLEAIAAVKDRAGKDPYGVVFMDWKMPGLDGLQATREILADPAIREKPAVVLVKAFGRDEVREEAEKAGVSGFLAKPVTRSMLVDTLVSIFAPAAGSGRGGRGAAGAPGWGNPVLRSPPACRRDARSRKPGQSPQPGSLARGSLALRVLRPTHEDCRRCHQLARAG